MSAIVVKNLAKTFGKTEALKGVNIDIKPGEMVALIGASGSGKSTLMRLISGFEHSDASENSQVVCNGRICQEEGKLKSQARQTRRDVGIIFQQFNLVNRMTLLSNVLTGLLGRISVFRGTFGFFNRAEKQIAMQALKRVGIDNYAGQRVSTLSGGQQQRGAIARAMIQGAKILLADEPIASLDPASARKVMSILKDINKQEKMTILVSLHQVEYARHFCPRVIALRDGKVAFDGPSYALTNDFLKELYGEASEELILPDAQSMDAIEQPPVRIITREEKQTVNA